MPGGHRPGPEHRRRPDNNGDAVLQPGETWRYTCTVKAADLFKTSTATVTSTADGDGDRPE